MFDISRRSLLAGSAAASAAGALWPLSGSPAVAAPPPVGTQNAGWYRYKVGTHEITVATDGVSRFKFPDTFVTNKKRDEVNEGAGRGASCNRRPTWSRSPIRRSS